MSECKVCGHEHVGACTITVVSAEQAWAELRRLIRRMLVA